MSILDEAPEMPEEFRKRIPALARYIEREWTSSGCKPAALEKIEADLMLTQYREAVIKAMTKASNNRQKKTKSA